MQTIKERLETLEQGHWLLIVAPTIEHMLTGTTRVGVEKNGTVKVMYLDGLYEQRAGADSIISAMDADNPSLFVLVEYVQAGRGSATNPTTSGEY